MTNAEFDTAIEKAWPEIARMTNQDIAQRVSESAIKKGPAVFESYEKLRNYMSAKARGLALNEHTLEKRRVEILRQYKFYKGKPVVTQDSDAGYDVENATDSLEEPLRTAVRAMLANGETLQQAAEYLDPAIPLTTRRRWISVAVKKLLAGPLRDYHAN